MARVQVKGERGDWARLRQGAVLCPLRFDPYIGDLRSVVPEMMKVALFAGEVFLISSHDNKLVAEKEPQRTVIAVATWSTSKKIAFNTYKCEATFFSSNTHGTNW